MTKFYVDNWITALRGSVVRLVFGTNERIVVFDSEHGEYSNTINFRFIEYISELSRPYCAHSITPCFNRSVGTITTAYLLVNKLHIS